MKVGKMAAVAIGGGILILQVANHKGYIAIDWDKVTKKADKVSDKLEEAVTGEAPKLMDKVSISLISKNNELNYLLPTNILQVRTFTRENPFIVTAFIGGFFIGLSC